ncbi:7-carboxy-7-deazaguanine synthase QueE [Rheinheimera sp. WS51]|uniref:7-carboxy-7-deazaguanine synthase QueE n=1 Tax=Rheinheimera sp. WS51 TaxID=3425886 RepID=UPI003D8EF2D5
MYKVNEIFQTIQGEGSYTGIAAIFIRLQGCPVGCSWCDTKHTWTIDHDKATPVDAIMAKVAETDNWATQSAEQILSLFVQQRYQAKHVVITGGEPCLYDLNPLCQLLHDNGFSTQIETSGTFEIKAPAETWVTVSPKINMQGGYKVLQSCLNRADEIKHPIAMQKHIDELLALIANTDISNKLIYLQPISQQQRATELAIAMCTKYNWRLSIQIHKYLGIN